jgi:enamine deaminase RidA (YjgF/YER057c/UK114 family)
MSSGHRIVNPPGWPEPKGYVNGIAARGETLFIAGQIGWNEKGEFEHDDLIGQFDRALENIVAVLTAAGGNPEHLVRMTVYVTDIDAYRNGLREVGRVWRARLGKNFPAMALVQVVALVERKALVEIEATAVLPSS